MTANTAFIITTPPGISTLSTSEVKNDLRDLQRSSVVVNPEESDDDCSVKSGDIISSTYPVQPRKTSKTLHRWVIYNHIQLEPAHDLNFNIQGDNRSGRE